ncbi:MAG: outer membrane protein assembly factor BamD [Verrucomicrobiaceae bacterium]|nr:MAG: outer membrane protein assembly factor BamD [Verrucomicrobiaceae bacterium]
MKKSATTRRFPRLRGGAPAITAAAILLAPLPAVHAQQPAPRPAEVVDDNPKPPRAQIVPDEPAPPPKADVVPDDEDENTAPEIKPTKPAPEAPAPAPSQEENTAPPETKPSIAPPVKPKPAPPAAKARSREDELFDYCEQLFNRGNYSVALRQYGEYRNIFPNGKHREEARFKIAECYYAQKNYDIAAQELDNYIRDHPSSKNRPKALYHTGEAHYSIGSRSTTLMEDRANHMGMAEAAYRAVLQTTKTGLYAGYAAFRLGCFAYNAAAQTPGQYPAAVRYFGIAAAQVPKDQPLVRFASFYFKGQSAKFSGSLKEAAAAFEEVVKTKEDNKYYEKALKVLAEMDLDAGRTAEAMKKYAVLAVEAREADTRAEAMVNAGMIQAKDGKTEEATQYFEDALKVPGATVSLSRARYGLIFAYYKRKDFPKVVDLWRGMSVDYSQLDDPQQAQLLLIVGSCYSATNQHIRAIEVYRILESSQPASPEAMEGGYKRLVSMMKLNDPRVTDEARTYIEQWSAQKPESDFIDKAWIVRAVFYYNRGVWKAAAESYGKVREQKLEPERLANFLFQKGFAEASDGDREALSTLTTFINKYPDDERLSGALLQRGLASLKFEDMNGALKDFQTVKDKYPKSDSAESAAYHAAKARRLKQDYAGAVEDYRAFLVNYPDTRVKPEVNYWIGTGLFMQHKYADCLEPLRTARNLDPKTYFRDVSLMLINALSQLASSSPQELDLLMAEVDSYMKGPQEPKIDPAILRWLGRTVFRDRHDYAAAARYLDKVVNRDQPAATEAVVWCELGESYLESGNAQLALPPLENHLISDAPPMAKARTHLLKARAYYALNRLEEATKSAEAGLNIDRETLVSAQLRLILGDVAMASKRYNEAASSYGLVMGNWEDPTLTPQAMEKYIAACEALGDAASAAKAEATRADLKKRYPRYQPTASSTTARNQ